MTYLSGRTGWPRVEIMVLFCILSFFLSQVLVCDHDEPNGHDVCHWCCVTVIRLYLHTDTLTVLIGMSLLIHLVPIWLGLFLIFIIEVVYVPENNTQDIPMFWFLCFSLICELYL